MQPALQFGAEGRVRDPLDAEDDFRNGDPTEKAGDRRNPRGPCSDGAIAACAFSQFRDDVGIEEPPTRAGRRRGSELDGITYRRPFPAGLTVEVLQARKRASTEQCRQGRRRRRRREASVILRRKHHYGVPSPNGHALRTRFPREPNELAEPRLGFLQAPSVSGAGSARRPGFRWRRRTTGGHAQIHLTRLVRNLRRMVALDKCCPLKRAKEAKSWTRLLGQRTSLGVADYRPSKGSRKILVQPRYEPSSWITSS